MKKFFKIAWSRYKYLTLSIALVLVFGGVLLALEGFKIARVYKEMTAGTANVVAVPDTIPFDFKNGLIIVKVKLNGKKEYDFILDTGAPTLIWDNVADELGLVKSDVSNTASDGNGQDQILQFFHCPSIEIGKLKYDGMNMADVNSLTDEIKCFANGGILGGNFLMHYNWQIDYKNERLIACSDFGKLNIPKNARKVETMFSMPQGQILIDDIGFLGYKDYFIMDTGFTGDFHLDKDLGEAILQKEKYKKFLLRSGYSGLSTGGRKKEVSKIIKAKLFLPIDTIQNVMLDMSAPRSRIGNKYLSQFENITIHYTSEDKAVYFGAKQSKPFDDLHFGFESYFDRKDNKFKIKNIYSNSVAEKAGVAIDDEIIAINDKDFSQINFNQYCENSLEGKKLFDDNVKSLIVKVKRNNESKTFQLEKAPLFK